MEKTHQTGSGYRSRNFRRAKFQFFPCCGLSDTEVQSFFRFSNMAATLRDQWHHNYWKNSAWVVASMVKILCQSGKRLQRKQKIRVEIRSDRRTTWKHNATGDFISGGINILHYKLRFTNLVKIIWNQWSTVQEQLNTECKIWQESAGKHMSCVSNS